MEIYKITNTLNFKVYIGKDTTTNPNYYGSGVILKYAIKKHGIANFTKEIIDTAANKEDLAKKEKYWIEYYNSDDREIGYNITKGGDGGDTISNNPNRNEIRRKLSETSPTRGKTYDDVYGIIKAKEYKMKLSESHKNRPKRIKKERLKKPDGRKNRWMEYNLEKERNKNKEILEIIENVKKFGVEYNIEKITSLKNNRYKFGFLNVANFYSAFGIFEPEVKEYYDRISLNKKKLTGHTFSHTEKTKNALRNKKMESARKDFEILKKNIDDNNIVELEDFFNELDSKNIRKRFLKGAIKNEIPQYYVEIMKKKIFKKFTISTDSLKSMEKKLGRKIEVDGVIYDSVIGASRILCMERNHIRARLKSDKWKNYRYIK
jgi:hypothetical protein